MYGNYITKKVAQKVHNNQKLVAILHHACPLCRLNYSSQDIYMSNQWYHHKVMPREFLIMPERKRVTIVIENKQELV